LLAKALDQVSDRYNDPMSGFVIKATDRDGTVAWISIATQDGIRSLTGRSQAAVFSTSVQADMAISRMHHAFADHGLIFEVKSAD
jgi:hypothetical protein